MEFETDSAQSESEGNRLPLDVECEEPAKKYECTHTGCNAVFLRPSRLARHVRQHTGEKPYKCDHVGCDKAYTNSSHLKRHRETHNPIKQTYKCTECTLTISNRHNLKRHYERVHKQNGRLSCQECGLNFNKEHKLIEHKAVHDGTILYKCDECNKQHTTLRAFKRHQEMHKSKKEYACTVAECPEVFSKWSILRGHMKNKHISEFKCTTCDKVFLRKTHLKVHSVVHSEDRTIIQCPYEKCPRFYFFKRNLDHHVRISHIGKKFHCDICDIRLASKQKLIQHMIKIHQLKKKKKLIKKAERNKRKDAGVAKKSMLSKLVGIDLSVDIEKNLLKRRTRIEEGNIFLERSDSGEQEEVIKDVEVTLMKVCNEGEGVSQDGCDALALERTETDSPNQIDKDQLRYSEQRDTSKMV